MSYCRWSSDDFKSDVYVYQADEGYVIHVASYKVVGDLPHLPPLGLHTDIGVWLEAYRAQMEAIDKAERAPIGLPYDGKTFVLDSLEDLEDQLRELQTLGYHVPAWALEDIAAERAAEEAQ